MSKLTFNTDPSNPLFDAYLLMRTYQILLCAHCHPLLHYFGKLECLCCKVCVCINILTCKLFQAAFCIVLQGFYNLNLSLYITLSSRSLLSEGGKPKLHFFVKCSLLFEHKSFASMCLAVQQRLFTMMANIAPHPLPCKHLWRQWTRIFMETSFCVSCNYRSRHIHQSSKRFLCKYIPAGLLSLRTKEDSLCLINGKRRAISPYHPQYST